MNIKLLIEHRLEFLSFKGGYIGSSESTVVKMPHCWKSHVTAHCIFFYLLLILLSGAEQFLSSFDKGHYIRKQC